MYRKHKKKNVWIGNQFKVFVYSNVLQMQYIDPIIGFGQFLTFILAKARQQ